MNKVVNQEYLAELAECIERNTDYLSMAFLMHIHDSKLKDVMEGKLYEMKWYLKRLYDPELYALKKQSRMYYQKWLVLKDSDEKTASHVYIEYLKIQCKIKLMDIPL